MNNGCEKLNKMVVLIYAGIANAEILMKELFTVMRSFHNILDLNSRLGFFNLFFCCVLTIQDQAGTWAGLAVSIQRSYPPSVKRYCYIMLTLECLADMEKHLEEQ